ncbi:MAG: hypothetical protein AB7F96_15665 [Beijerinckiaceae bacterium]
MTLIAGMFANPFAAFWSLLAIYACIGILVAIPFAIAGAHRILDEPAHMTAGARLAIVPGAIVLWPIVLRRWLAAGRQA